MRSKVVWFLGLFVPMIVGAQAPNCDKAQVICAYSLKDTTSALRQVFPGTTLRNVDYQGGAWLTFTLDTSKTVYRASAAKLSSAGRSIRILFRDQSSRTAYNKLLRGPVEADDKVVAQSKTEPAKLDSKGLNAAEPPKTDTVKPSAKAVAKTATKVEPKKSAKAAASTGDAKKTEKQADPKFVVIDTKAPHVDSAALIEKGKQEKAREVAAKLDSLTEKARRDSLEKEAVKNQAAETFGLAQAKESAASAKLDSANKLLKIAEALQDTVKRPRSTRQIPVSKDTSHQAAPRPAAPRQAAPLPAPVTRVNDTTINRVTHNDTTINRTVYNDTTINRVREGLMASTGGKRERPCWKHFSWCTGTVGVSLLTAATGIAICVGRKDHCHGKDEVNVDNHTQVQIGRTLIPILRFTPRRP